MLFIGTTTPLAAGATYTSSVLNANLNLSLIGLMYSDQPGTLYIDQSSDGVNWDYTTTTALTASTGTPFTISIYAPYVQMRFTNTSASAQTVLRISSIFNNNFTGEPL